MTADVVLDNPAWFALNGAQASFGVTAPLAARYHPEISPIGALREPTLEALDALAEISPRDPVALVTTVANLPESARLRVVRSVALRQMVSTAQAAPLPLDAVQLGANDADEVLALVALTEPGPFARRTLEFGNYLGVREAGRLLAMAGVRLKPPAWTEVSGVCTHPDGRGRGYALALVIAVTNAIVGNGDGAFLHVAIGSPSERTAMRVYERAGFHERRQLHLHVLAPG